MVNKKLSQIKYLLILQRLNPQRRKEKVYIGCGAGFGGDRPLAALKLLQRVTELDYLVLECLAERTLAERYQAMKAGGKGYDPRSMFLQFMITSPFFFFLAYQLMGVYVSFAFSFWKEYLRATKYESNYCFFIAEIFLCSF